MDDRKSPLGMLSPVQTFVFGIVAGVLVLCAVGFFILLKVVLGDNFNSAKGASPSVAQVAAPTAQVPNNAAPVVGDVPAVTADDHVKGGKNAKVTLVEYSDFECPFCGSFFSTLQQAEQEYGDDIKIVYRHFPLSFHPEGTPAAEASECAAEQGKFWEFHDYIFQNQTRISAALYTEAAGKIGLNAKKFADCVSSRKYSQKVIDQQNGGSVAGVGGTPHTIILGPNGEVIPLSGALPYPQVKSAIDSVLK